MQQTAITSNQGDCQHRVFTSILERYDDSTILVQLHSFVLVLITLLIH